MTKLHSNQKGLVSIIVTVILMLVISITVLGFAQIIRREQRQALDNQLSSQAFYAAESGVNDARKYIASLAGAIPTDKTDCKEQGPYTRAVLPMDIETSTKTGYTCLLITGSPKSLKYDLSTSEPSKVFPIDASNTPISRLDISWTPSTTVNPLSGCPATVSTALPTATAWPCRGYGIVRIDIVPADVLNRSLMSRESFTAFLTPVAGAGNGAVNYTGSGININGGTANQGARPAARCDTTSCKITINIGAGNRKYYARVLPIYRDTSVSVLAKDSNGNDLSLRGAQVLIDSTGRSQDVLRRIQVRVPLVNDGLHADFAIQTTDSMCKQFKTYPSSDFTNSTPGC